MSKLEKVRNKAKRLGIDGLINHSTRKDKKFMINLGDEVIHFGQEGYKDYLDHGDKKRRASYLARAVKIRDKSGRLVANDKHSPNFYAIRLLW